MYFLISPDIMSGLQAAARSPSAPSGADATAFVRAAPSDILRTTGDVAEITVSGVLTERPNLLAFLFGGGNTTYQQIREAFADAKSDARVQSVRLRLNSPGGEVAGLFETLLAIDDFDKPVDVRAAMATSAAYAIAAAAGPITATNPAAAFGSIGVAASIFVSDSFIDLTNTASPDKRPDVRTQHGKSVVRKHLDDIFELFVDSIAKGRGTTPATVKADYGQGRVVLAREARGLGMIDELFAAGEDNVSAEVREAKRYAAKMRAIRAGEIQAPAGIAQRDYEDRLLADDRDLESFLADERRGVSDDPGDLIADAMDRIYGPPGGEDDIGDASGETAEREGEHGADGKDDGDLIADSMDRLYGPVTEREVAR